MKGGTALQDVVIVSAMLGNVGIYNSLLMPAAEQLQALCAEDYLFIKWMRWKHPKYGVQEPQRSADIDHNHISSNSHSDRNYNINGNQSHINSNCNTPTTTTTTATILSI